MTPINVNKDSLVWRLASVYGSLSPDVIGTDICTLTKACSWGVVVVSMLLTMAGLVAIAIGDTGGWIVAMVATLSWISPSDVARGMCAVIAVIGLLITWGFVAMKLNQRAHLKDHTPSVVNQAYQSFKGKYCVPVRINSPE